MSTPASVFQPPSGTASPPRRSRASGPRRTLPTWGRAPRSIRPSTGWSLPEACGGSRAASTTLPGINRLTGKPTYPNPRDVIDALARKGKVRVVVDGITAANDLGLTDAVPARIERAHRWAPAAHHPRQSDPRLSVRRAQPPLLGGPPRHALRAGAPLAARHASVR